MVPVLITILTVLGGRSLSVIKLSENSLSDRIMPRIFSKWRLKRFTFFITSSALRY